MNRAAHDVLGTHALNPRAALPERHIRSADAMQYRASRTIGETISFRVLLERLSVTSRCDNSHAIAAPARRKGIARRAQRTVAFAIS